MATRDVLTELQDWYLDQCDGDWEHSNGVAIGTLDNPGWSIKIDLERTEAAERSFIRFEQHRDDEDWVELWKEHTTLHAACGPNNLTKALTHLLDWLTRQD